jgi:hypothetical protein
MTEDDKFRIEFHRSDSFYGDPLAADRIEELLELNKELTLQLLAVHGQAADALDKLTKAGIVALETILNERGLVFDAMVEAAEDAAGKGVSFNVVVGRAIRAALAELEGKE